MVTWIGKQLVVGAWRGPAASNRQWSGRQSCVPRKAPTTAGDAVDGSTRTASVNPAGSAPVPGRSNSDALTGLGLPAFAPSRCALRPRTGARRPPCCTLRPGTRHLTRICVQIFPRLGPAPEGHDVDRGCPAAAQAPAPAGRDVPDHTRRQAPAWWLHRGPLRPAGAELVARAGWTINIVPLRGWTRRQDRQGAHACKVQRAGGHSGHHDRPITNTRALLFSTTASLCKVIPEQPVTM
jgi:hypothetical protein